MYVVKHMTRTKDRFVDQKRLELAQSRSELGSGEYIADAALKVIEPALPAREEIQDAVIKAVIQCVADELKFLRSVKSPKAEAAFFENEDARAVDYVNHLTELMGNILDHIPTGDADSGVLMIDVPLVALVKDQRALVHGLVEKAVGRHFDGEDLNLGGGLAKALVGRLCKASGLSLDQAQEKPHKLKWPRDMERDGVELVRLYLEGTPLAGLLLTPVPVVLTDSLRMEHMLITAGSGHGKTQTLQHMLASDLARPRGEEVGLVVIDSQGDLIGRLSRLEVFAGNRRLMLVDASDVEYPVGLNLFDLGGVPLSKLNRREREQVLNATVQLYEYVIGGLFGAEMTQRQSTVFRFLIRLMMAIPNATIHTLRECLEEPRDFMHVMERMPPTAKQFFLNEFMDKHFAETRKQILRRLYGVLQNPAFERMFASPQNKVDIYQALNEGRVVLCNTSREFLQGECSVFGRYCIAVAMKAAFDRARLPLHERRTSYLYIDEASDYFDESVGQLLAQARKYKLGVVLAHQALDQMSDGLRALVMSNTSIKLAGGASSKDARSLAPELRTTPEFILGQDKAKGGTRFACYARNLTPTAVTWRVPFGTLEGLGTMSEAAYEDLLLRNRSEVSSGQIDEAADDFAQDVFMDFHQSALNDDVGDDFSEPY